MIKKRVVPYFLLMAFPMGLGAGAANWLKLPRLPIPQLIVHHEIGGENATIEKNEAPMVTETDWTPAMPDFSAIHPLVVGSFSLLLCTGILLAADKTPPAKADAT